MLRIFNRNRDVLCFLIREYALPVPSLLIPPLDVNRNAMAMVGAASAATGVTQTLSTAILIVEMTGEFDVLILAMVSKQPFTFNYLLLSKLGVVISMAISSSITQDIFEVILQLRRLPYMPTLNVRYVSKPSYSTNHQALL